MTRTHGCIYTSPVHDIVVIIEHILLCYSSLFRLIRDFKQARVRAIMVGRYLEFTLSALKPCRRD
jgi:hypothetical protein